MSRDTSGRFTRGSSGNLSGRPPGRGLTHQMRDALRQATPLVLRAMVAKAIDGDVKAASVVLARALPELRQQDEALPVGLGSGSAADRGRRVVDALAAGELTPQQAEQAMSSLMGLVKLIEAAELERRVAELEQAQNKQAEAARRQRR